MSIFTDEEILAMGCAFKQYANWLEHAAGPDGRGSTRDKFVLKCVAKDMRREASVLTDPVNVRRKWEFLNKQVGKGFTFPQDRV